MSAIAAERRKKLVEHGIVSWLVATNHKRVGILYMVTSIAFFALAGVFADVIRLQLAAPGNN
ncbi:MAG: hypothetical protein JO349_03380, partial [Candidatus Eremiobacteraeota bacterium]|nr:hypothetical protein [Candidatus Eremiobacteraeota bacterium]